jgi:hypothetical protein
MTAEIMTDVPSLVLRLLNQEDTEELSLRERQKVGGRDPSSLERWLKHPPSNA